MGSIGVNPREGAVFNEHVTTTVSEGGSVGVNGCGAGMNGEVPGLEAALEQGLVLLVPALVEMDQSAPELGLASVVAVAMSAEVVLGLVVVQELAVVVQVQRIIVREGVS